jgi:hypothetical protein
VSTALVLVGTLASVLLAPLVAQALADAHRSTARRRLLAAERLHAGSCCPQRSNRRPAGSAARAASRPMFLATVGFAAWLTGAVVEGMGWL